MVLKVINILRKKLHFLSLPNEKSYIEKAVQNMVAVVYVDKNIKVFLAFCDIPISHVVRDCCKHTK